MLGSVLAQGIAQDEGAGLTGHYNSALCSTLSEGFGPFKQRQPEDNYMTLRDLLEKKDLLGFSDKQRIKDVPALLAFLEKEQLIGHGDKFSVRDFTGLLNLLMRKGIITAGEKAGIVGL